MTVLSTLGAFILGLQHGIEPENVAISLFIASLSKRNYLKHLIVYLVTLSSVDTLLGASFIFIGQWFIPTPEFIVKPVVGAIFIFSGILLMKRISRQSLKLRTHERTWLVVIIAGLLHSFIVDPHHPLFFPMLTFLRNLREAILVLSSFIFGIIASTSVIVLAMAVIHMKVNNGRLSSIQRTFGAILIAIGIMYVAF